MRYILMHKELLVLELELDEITGGISEIGQLYEPAHIPVGIAIQDDTVDRAGLNHWWQSRSIPASRSGIREALEKLGVATPQLLLSKCFGLSLSDQYWMRPGNQNVKWSEINFFQNPFSEDVGNILFGAPPIRDMIDLISPDNTSDGMLKKRWKIIDGIRCMIKGGSKPFHQEPLNEVFATRLMERLGVEHVPYRLLQIDGLPYSVCPDFVTKETELVSAHHISKVLPFEAGVSKYQHFLRCCNALGIPGVQAQLDQMLAVDFLLANEDRHTGNFGALRNADTLEWIGPAPIYDCGTSLWYDHLFRWGGPDTHCPSKPFADRHAEQIQLVTSFDWIDFSRLESAADELREIFSSAPRFIDDERCTVLEEAFQWRVDQLREVVLERRV